MSALQEIDRRMLLFLRPVVLTALSLSLAAGQGALPAPKAGPNTALDRYVQRPDPAYAWKLERTLTAPGATAYLLDLTSQSWRKPEEVDRTLWRHWLTIIKPEGAAAGTAMLFITGDANTSPAPQRPDAGLLDVARTTGTVVAELRMVPNQPLRIAGDPNDLKEDGIISLTWKKFLDGGDDEWLARMPMTKSAVRAMDAVTAFLASPEGGALKVDRYVVAGASKRGWTTWTTAAVDHRVVAIVPLVIDLLNMQPSFEHHYRVYGFWAPAIKDYEERGIMDRSRTPRYREMLQLVEPYSYRDRLTMPKYIVNAAGDQFFLPDSSQFYFDGLQGEKYLRYVPNTDHSLKDSDARQGLTAFYDAVVHGRPRPRFTWSFARGGSIRVKTTDRPSAVKLWRATNPDKRDFRLESIGPAYKATDLMARPGGTYVARVAAPAKGWTAYFVELTFPSGGKYDYKFTTGVRVTPDHLPYPPFTPKRPVGK